MFSTNVDGIHAGKQFYDIFSESFLFFVAFACGKLCPKTIIFHAAFGEWPQL